MRRLLCLLVLSAALRPAYAASPPELSASALCEQAIQAAEAKAHTPPGMLAAIGQVESGRPDPRTGAMRPWPWTIDANGVGQFFPTKAEAIAAVTMLQAQGVQSIDVGCMQVNLLHHPDAFATLAQAFDPVANTAYAARFINALHGETGDWTKSIAAYHSRTPQLGEDYQRRVAANWQHGFPPAGPSPRYVDTGLVFGAFGSSGRVYGLILPMDVTQDRAGGTTRP